MKKFRVYIDTSVIGGCFDKEFSRESNLLIKMAEKGNIVLLISDLLADELEESPPEVQAFIREYSISIDRAGFHI